MAILTVLHNIRSVRQCRSEILQKYVTSVLASPSMLLPLPSCVNKYSHENAHTAPQRALRDPLICAYDLAGFCNVRSSRSFSVEVLLGGFICPRWCFGYTIDWLILPLTADQLSPMPHRPLVAKCQFFCSAPFHVSFRVDGVVNKPALISVTVPSYCFR